MARGRMINSKIVMNRAINGLSDDTSRLAFTWLITFADVEGRTYGDPALLRSLLFPRRTDITIEQMDGYVREWAQAGLVTWYEADGDQWIEFPKFAENQVGMDTRKEAKSTVPAPPDATEQVRSEYVPSTYQVQSEYSASTVEQNRTEVKQNRSEEKCGATAPAAEAATPAPTASVDDAASEKEPVKPKRNDPRSDPRSKHPAIQCVRGIMGGKYPPREMYDTILETLGERPDGVRAANCRKAWVERGFNRASWIWLTEWYAQGGPPAKNVPRSNGHGNGGMSAVDEAIRQFREGG